MLFDSQAVFAVPGTSCCFLPKQKAVQLNYILSSQKHPCKDHKLGYQTSWKRKTQHFKVLI